MQPALRVGSGTGLGGAGHHRLIGGLADAPARLLVHAPAAALKSCQRSADTELGSSHPVAVSALGGSPRLWRRLDSLAWGDVLRLAAVRQRPAACGRAGSVLLSSTSCCRRRRYPGSMRTAPEGRSRAPDRATRRQEERAVR